MSQIVDYDDIYILEQEYDAILNNLNLEMMPKDEALLAILKQLLNTITFFRIQEDEKALLEEEYQHNMKNAMWNAVPSLSTIVAGGSPVTMLAALATQVGIGYMNYRKVKAENTWQYEKQNRKLAQSAMEQFNGLRRELFDTAWRLADKYHFPDEYRLTERQITQYNAILMDADYARQYERLSYIQHNFDAYPPFWFYLGHAANAVSQDKNLDDDVRKDYRARAARHFKKFRETAKYNILREDQIAASCALEYFGLTDDIEEKRQLLESVRKHSGNAFDILQMCALMYLNIGDLNEASNLLRMLVNEGYNQTVNAQFLSRIYVTQVIDAHEEARRIDYKILAERIPNKRVLYPMPGPEDNSQALRSQFRETQRQLLREEYRRVVYQFVSKYEFRYNALCRQDGDITDDMVQLIRELCEFSGDMFGDNQTSKEMRRLFTREVSNALEQCQTPFVEMLRYKDRRNAVSYQKITESAFRQLTENIKYELEQTLSLKEISSMEVSLLQFCRKVGISLSSQEALCVSVSPTDNIMSAIFGSNYIKKQKEEDQKKLCIDVMKKYKDCLIVLDPAAKDKTGKIQMSIIGDGFFDSYIKRNFNLSSAFEGENMHGAIPTWDHVIAVLNDKTLSDKDLLITTKGLAVTCRFMGLKMMNGAALYRDITMTMLGPSEINHLGMRTKSWTK